MATIADTIANLDKARTLVLSDAVYYKDIVPAILPSIGPSAQLDLRRWGAEFLAEAFAAPKFAQDKKQEVAVLALETLKGLLELQPEDTGTVKSVVQASSSIYPLIFRHTISNPNDATTWQKMAAIKTNILRRMDNASPGVRICCIKFVQRVVQTQTPGLIADPRRPEQNDISIALVPRDHPLIPPKNLEPEASGLLDRLLGILQDNDSLGVLVRARPSISPKIVSAVLNFNPFRQADLPMTLRLKLEIRSMERTAKCFSTSILKMPKIPQHLQGQTAQRLEQHVQRLQQMRQELDGGGNRKRAAPAEPTDGLDQAKRQRLGAQIATPAQPGPFPPLPQGPISIAQLFTLTQDAGAKSFDVQQLPIDLVVRILVPIIGAIDKTKLDNAVNAARARYLSLPTTQPASALRAATVATGLTKAGGDEEDDDYEPDYEPTEDANQIMNKLDSTSSPTMLPEAPPEVALGPFRLPTPPPMSEQEIEECGKHMVRRIFATMTDLEEKPSTKTKQTGFNRLAASNHDRDAWVTIISRLATRASAGLEDAGAPIKSEEEHGGNVSKKPFSLSNMIRDSLYLYVVEDFRRRLGVAISWLNEEWYNDRIQALQHDGASEPAPPQHYETWALKVLDGIMPYIDANDKSRVIQFLSEIPVVSQEMLDRIKKLAGDPERVALTTQALLYLVMFKPPAREIAVDALEDLWRNNAEARPSAGKMLKKWRPKVLEEANSSKSPDIKGEGS
ncbi:MAG: hypothetical protein M1822_000154 [Bathelium mastoideum]|nr:MAG: hypothetical protein M1822_000154 [Bathelium mastoideum]